MISFSVGINGIIYGSFKGRRGLRQGDHLSLLLFGLYLEVFSRSMKDVSMRPDFHFNPIFMDNGITHLTYVDDLLVFARVNESAIALIVECQEIQFVSYKG